MGLLQTSCARLTLIAFFDRVTGLVDQGNAVDIVYLDFSKVFRRVSPDLLHKMVKHGLDDAV